MIVYNVTCNLHTTMAEEWLSWIQNEHIPEVIQSGCFIEFKILKLLNASEDDDRVNYAIQYTALNMGDYLNYKETYATALQAKTKAKYGDNVLAYRSLLEVIV